MQALAEKSFPVYNASAARRGFYAPRSGRYITVARRIIPAGCVRNSGNTGAAAFHNSGYRRTLLGQGPIISGGLSSPVSVTTIEFLNGVSRFGPLSRDGARREFLCALGAWAVSMFSVILGGSVRDSTKNNVTTTYAKLHTVNGIPNRDNGASGLESAQLDADPVVARSLLDAIKSAGGPVVAELDMKMQQFGVNKSVRVIGFKLSGNLADFAITSEGIRQLAAGGPRAAKVA